MLAKIAATAGEGGERGRLAKALLATLNEPPSAPPLPPTNHWIELRKSEGRIKQKSQQLKAALEKKLRLQKDLSEVTAKADALAEELATLEASAHEALEAYSAERRSLQGHQEAPRPPKVLGLAKLLQNPEDIGLDDLGLAALVDSGSLEMSAEDRAHLERVKATTLQTIVELARTSLGPVAAAIAQAQAQQDELTAKATAAAAKKRKCNADGVPANPTAAGGEDDDDVYDMSKVDASDVPDFDLPADGADKPVPADLPSAAGGAAEVTPAEKAAGEAQRAKIEAHCNARVSGSANSSGAPPKTPKPAPPKPPGGPVVLAPGDAVHAKAQQLKADPAVDQEFQKVMDRKRDKQRTEQERNKLAAQRKAT